jgi:hypothetical protein
MWEWEFFRDEWRRYPGAVATGEDNINGEGEDNINSKREGKSAPLSGSCEETQRVLIL